MSIKKKLVWVTDIHLDWLTEPNTNIISESRVRDYCQEILSKQPNWVVITGDISTATSIEVHLMWLEKYLPDIPIYFVLGNHDYYYGSIPEVRSRIQKYNGVKTRTQWLNVTPIVKLTEKTCLIGHDGWYDGGYGNWFKSKLIMTEYQVTEDFRFQPPLVVHHRLQELSQQCADHIEKYVPSAVNVYGYKNIIFATHVPPFKENTRAPNRNISDSNWLPNMSSKKAGDALLKVAKAYPQVSFTCLSGHTHTFWKQKYSHNLVCYTGEADYGNPKAHIEVLEIE
jgi:predicted phosphohydrolase